MKAKLLCLILLTMHALTLGAFADGAPNNITDRLTVQIPSLAEYETFESTGENGGSISFVFRSPEKPAASVTASKDGIILSYYIGDSGYKKIRHLPAVSKAQASEAAIGFVQIAAADIFDQLNTKVFTNTYNISSDGYNVRFTRSVFGISYIGDSVSVWVDGRTGGVTRYSRSWNSELTFFPPNEIYSQVQAEDLYKNKISLSLRYNKKIKNGKAIPYLVYVPSNTGAIDAVTGDVINGRHTSVSNSYKEMISLYENTTITAAAIGESSAREEGLATGREAQRYVRTVAELNIDDGYTTEQAKYYKNTNDDYLMTLKFTKTSYTSSVTLDARTLEIIGFFNGETAEKKGDKPIDKTLATVEANKYISKYMGKYAKELSPPQVSTDSTELCAVLYERVVNEIPYKSNYVQFLINSDGDIVSMFLSWDRTAFEDPLEIINEKEAYSIFFSKVGLQLVYTRTAESNEVRLVYAVNPQLPAIIRASDGDILSYDGSKAKPKKALAYLGLDGHYAEAQATTLADCDIFVSAGSVNLDADILQKDFILLLSAISPDGVPVFEKPGGLSDEELDIIYNDFVTKGILDKDEVNPDGFVLREDSVKYLLRVAGYRDVAELEGIFKMPFKDSKSILPDYYGYVALARGLNLIAGSDGYFHPTRRLTNADALIMIYNYLSR